MGKVIVLISTTIDGYADAENVVVDPEFFAFTHTIMSTSTLAAFGRKTFETFQQRWPQRLIDPSTPDWVRRMAQALNDIPKVVFSSTLNETTWYNSTVVRELSAGYIASIKKNNGGAFLTFGSPGLIDALTDMNAVDEYYFNVQPVIPVEGKSRLFEKSKLKSSLALKYVDSTSLASGAHIVHYRNEAAI